MKPYYEESGITIWHGDCREILPTLPKVDLVLTDPPYNVGKNYGVYDDKQPPEVYRQFCMDWFELCKQIGNRVVLFPGHGNLGMWFGLQKPSGVGCWYKPGNPGHGALFQFCEWEPWLVYNVQGCKPIAGGDAIRSPISNQSGVGDHPCPKPLSLFKKILVKCHSELVLDPFMGSGTTLRAAKDLGRKAIGIEIEEKYCEIAANRLRQEVLQFQ